MAVVAQLVRALDCGSKCRGFESRRSPTFTPRFCMTTLQALLIGLLQGLTEFLPISSSAHLKLAKVFLNIPSGEEQVVFDLVCHLGTLIAVLLFLRKDILALYREKRDTLKLIIIALFPLVPMYFFLKPLRDFASDISFLGFSLIFTSMILFLAGKIQLKKNPSKKISDALFIGSMQSAALIPGISRSASTIAAARFRGWEASDAVRFSFLLSIPTILGGNALELLKIAISKQNLERISFSSCIIGFLSSFIIGMIVIRYAIRFLEKGNLKPFAWYCLTLGIITTLYFYG